ncbi:hypothetical protein ACVWY2_006037 [Bradyrhizobium sp. JR6.1]
MQTLALQLTTTFVDDAIELVKGFGRASFLTGDCPDRADRPRLRRRRCAGAAARGSARAAQGGGAWWPVQVAQLPMVAVRRPE